MEHFYYVYKITCLMDEWNGMFYIGKHFGKIDDNYTGSGKLIKEYFAKYGKVKNVTYIKEIIDYGPEDNICDLERDYIRKGQQSELCLNMICHSSTGCFGLKHSEETKQKIREAHKGKRRKPFSEDHLKHMSESLKGKNNPMYGKKHSDETRRKISESMKKRSEKNKK